MNCEYGFLGLFGSHDWGKWKHIEVSSQYFWEKEPHDSVRQIRECEKCGKMELRHI